jgi:sulfur carrier protein
MRTDALTGALDAVASRSPMRLTLNGEPHDLPDEMTVSLLLEHLDLKGPVAVERNQQVVPRAEHRTERLASGDVIEIVHFVGGG